jgi:hypothetical protein
MKTKIENKNIEMKIKVEFKLTLFLKKYLFLFVAIIIVISTQNYNVNGSYENGQSEITFLKVFEGDDGYSVKQTLDGGYIITGNADHGICLYKLDSYGKIEWYSNYGNEFYDSSRAVFQTLDGGYIILGSKYYSGSLLKNIWLIKTDSSGNIEWNKFYGGNRTDSGYSIQQTDDDGYIILGDTYSYGSGGCDVWLIKTDSNGVEQWNKTYGGNKTDYGRCIEITADNGYVITGCTESGDSDDIWVIKTDSNGIEQWNKTYGGTHNDIGNSIQQTSDGGYIIGGKYGWPAIPYGELGYLYISKIDANGNVTWSERYGGSGNEIGYDVLQTLDGEYIIVGATSSYGNGEVDVYLIKVSANGYFQWRKTIGGESSDYGYSIDQTSDGGYIIAGKTYSYGSYSEDIFVIKTDSSGNANDIDTDDDGTSDLDDKDDDGDGISDVWEKEYGLDHLDPNDAEEDWDSDGYSNHDEFKESTDPLDPDSKPPKDEDYDYLPFCYIFGIIIFIVIILLLALYPTGKDKKVEKETIEENIMKQTEPMNENVKSEKKKVKKKIKRKIKTSNNNIE